MDQEISIHPLSQFAIPYILPRVRINHLEEILTYFLTY
jgi:hypothetical protein